MLGEFEYFLRTALDWCAEDGAAPHDIIHVYLDFDGMDFCFVHNPAGVHGKTLSVSGRNIFLDDKTKLIICSFSPLTAGTGRMKSSSMKTEFFKGNNSVIQVYNSIDKTCFRFMVLGLSKLEKFASQPILEVG